MSATYQSDNETPEEAALRAQAPDHPRVTVWIPPDIKADLDRMSRLLGRPLWAVVVEALTAFQRSLPEAERKALDVMKRR